MVHVGEGRRCGTCRRGEEVYTCRRGRLGRGGEM